MNVLIVLGHPRRESLCGALARAYERGAAETGVNVRSLAVTDLEFDPNVRTEEPTDQHTEPDVAAARREIEWADHLVFVYPNWWGTMPALLKGFFDRTFAPGFAFSFYDEGEGAGHEELLSEKTAELLVTMDVPPLVYRLIQRQPGTNAVKGATLDFAGIRTTRVTHLGPVEGSEPEERAGWLAEAEALGRSLAGGPDTRWSRIRYSVSAWLRALRLQFYPMAWVAYTIGALGAVGSDAFTSLAYWLGLSFLFFLEAATVLSNEYADYETDRRNTFAGPFTGGSQVLVDGALGFRQIEIGILIALSLAGLSGIGVLATGTGPLPVMAGSMLLLAVLALGYTLAPLKLSYRTLGELDVAVTHSLGVLLPGFVVLGGDPLDPLPWLVGLPYLLAILPSITLSAIPDHDADRAAGKRTIAVRFGIDGGVRFAQVTALLASLAGVALYVSELVPGAYNALVLLSVPHALGLAWLLELRVPDEPRRIDGPMIAALSYLTWFALAPLVALL
ncbi:NAD(P)H-dependent oxidoreductase [Natronorarus salvus]|uniref:NAD(P)H-dependent oxidoreductase n=1 Tax=Natronorarus salvus TaxID=3117733 RepID=UPI002F2626B2